MPNHRSILEQDVEPVQKIDLSVRPVTGPHNQSEVENNPQPGAGLGSTRM